MRVVLFLNALDLTIGPYNDMLPSLDCLCFVTNLFNVDTTLFTH